ncbi:MAG: zf-TFIIB domain-containing protein, partial [Nitrospinaceae bacterium]|nr:zf-TFIIB domain-containing protein [Nitrospinaceae bacterium]NIU97248.1 hypothetical protein [Nitrospinaceae bacterium]
MKCPACDNRLSQREAGGVTVDVCKEGCGGIWFDNYEFEKFDEPHESEGETLLNVTKVNGFQVDTTARRNCPKCPGIVMARHFVSVKRHVEIDECPGCGGIWLDAGELHQIRSLFRSEGDRKQAANSYFQEVF